MELHVGHSSNRVSDIMKYLWMKWEGTLRFTLCGDTGCSINSPKLITADKFWIRTCQRDVANVSQSCDKRDFDVHWSYFSALSDKTCMHMYACKYVICMSLLVMTSSPSGSWNVFESHWIILNTYCQRGYCLSIFIYIYFYILYKIIHCMSKKGLWCVAIRLGVMENLNFSVQKAEVMCESIAQTVTTFA